LLAAVAAAKHEATQLDLAKAKNLVIAIAKSGNAAVPEREKLLKAVGLVCLEEGLRLQGSPLHVTLHQLEDCVNRIAIQDSLAVLGGDIIFPPSYILLEVFGSF